MSKNSLLKTWASTSNAIMTTKMGNYGLTVGMDELSMYRGQDLKRKVVLEPSLYPFLFFSL